MTKQRALAISILPRTNEFEGFLSLNAKFIDIKKTLPQLTVLSLPNGILKLTGGDSEKHNAQISNSVYFHLHGIAGSLPLSPWVSHCPGSRQDKVNFLQWPGEAWPGCGYYSIPPSLGVEVKGLQQHCKIQNVHTV